MSQENVETFWRASRPSIEATWKRDLEGYDGVGDFRAHGALRDGGEPSSGRMA